VGIYKTENCTKSITINPALVAGLIGLTSPPCCSHTTETATQRSAAAPAAMTTSATSKVERASTGGALSVVNQ
jgi:hypothetical protein